MKRETPVLTDQELRLLKIIWRLGHATVREVYLDLLKERKVAYTTVLTMMGVLERKGHVQKKAGEKAYVYTAAQPESKVMARMVSEFVTRVFNGSRQPLLLHLLGDRSTSEEDLAEAERLLKSRRKK